MTPAQLIAVGQALHGERWQTPLARDLSVSDRTMRRWLAGDQRMPAGLWGDCCALLRARRIEINQILGEA